MSSLWTQNGHLLLKDSSTLIYDDECCCGCSCCKKTPKTIKVQISGITDNSPTSCDEDDNQEGANGYSSCNGVYELQRADNCYWELTDEERGSVTLWSDCDPVYSTSSPCGSWHMLSITCDGTNIYIAYTFSMMNCGWGYDDWTFTKTIAGVDLDCTTAIKGSLTPQNTPANGDWSQCCVDSGVSATIV